MGPKWDGEKADASQSWREIMRADGHHLFILLSIYFVLSLQAVWPQLSDEKTKKENSKKRNWTVCLERRLNCITWQKQRFVWTHKRAPKGVGKSDKGHHTGCIHIIHTCAEVVLIVEESHCLLT